MAGWPITSLPLTVRSVSDSPRSPAALAASLRLTIASSMAFISTHTHCCTVRHTLSLRLLREHRRRERKPCVACGAGTTRPVPLNKLSRSARHRVASRAQRRRLVGLLRTPPPCPVCCDFRLGCAPRAVQPVESYEEGPCEGGSCRVDPRERVFSLMNESGRRPADRVRRFADPAALVRRPGPRGGSGSGECTSKWRHTVASQRSATAASFSIRKN
jgi:hypothetical protein